MLTFAILLIVAGAVLRFAVDATVPGISLQKVGVILMMAGALVLVLALVFGYADPGYHQVIASSDRLASRISRRLCTPRGSHSSTA